VQPWLRFHRVRELAEEPIALFLSEAGNAPPAGDPIPKAIIGPHAGYVYSGPVAARAYARLAAARGKISRVVLIGPSHHLAFRGLAVDASDAWETPSGTVQLDTETIARLRQLPMVGQLDAAHQREHALLFAGLDHDERKARSQHRLQFAARILGRGVVHGA